MDSKSAYQWTSAAQHKLSAADRLYSAAVTYASRHDYVNAQRVLKDVVRIRKAVLPARDMPIIVAMDLQANLFGLTGEKFRQREILRELVSSYQKKFGECHSDTQTILERYYNVLLQCGDEKEAQGVADQLWSARGARVGTQATTRDLAVMLEVTKVSPELEKKMELHMAANPGLKVVSLPTRSNRFLSDSWDPMKELEVAKIKKENGGKLPDGFDIDNFTTSGQYVKPEVGELVSSPIVLAAMGDAQNRDRLTMPNVPHMGMGPTTNPALSMTPSSSPPPESSPLNKMMTDEEIAGLVKSNKTSSNNPPGGALGMADPTSSFSSPSAGIAAGGAGPISVAPLDANNDGTGNKVMTDEELDAMLSRPKTGGDSGGGGGGGMDDVKTAGPLPGTPTLNSAPPVVGAGGDTNNKVMTDEELDAMLSRPKGDTDMSSGKFDSPGSSAVNSPRTNIVDDN